MPRWGKKHPAFTLIELLLVIVIVALLVGMTLPGLFRARQAAYAVQCAARQSQLIVGIALHAHDHRGLLPYPNWKSPFAEEVHVGWLYEPPVATWERGVRMHGSLWSYTRSHDVYRCGSHRAFQEGSAQVTSFLMNGAVIAYGDQARAPRPFRIDQFRSGSAIFWDAEDIEFQSDNGVGGDRCDGATWPGIIPRARHANGINVALIDGAVRSLSLSEYQDQLLVRPGMLWCVPTSRTGD